MKREGRHRVRSFAIAWRAKSVVPRASVATFALLVAYALIEPLVQGGVREAAGAVLPWPGIAMATAQAVLDSVYLGICGVFLGVFLEALLCGRTLQASMPRLLPSRRAAVFALAFAPFALVGAAIPLAIGRALSRFMATLSPAQIADLQAPLPKLALTVFEAPALSWILPSLFIAPLAVRWLTLPRLGPHPPSTRPSAAFVGLILLAVGLEIGLEHGIATALKVLPILRDTPLPDVIGWYVGVFTMLVLLGAGVASMLVRRLPASQRSDGGYIE
jgi:hypothetical protein